MKVKKTLILAAPVVAGLAIIPALTVSCQDNSETKLKFATETGITQTLAGQGSSSVVPIISAIVEDSAGKLAYKSTGSGGGFKAVNKAELGSDKFGMTSSTKYPKGTESWANKNLRTVTWALDAIGIAVHLPAGVKTTDDKRPIVDIKQLGKAYTGVDVTWSELITNLAAPNNTKVKVYGRTGGKGASGTADGFMHTLLKHTTYDKNKKSDISNHKVLPNENLTEEANTAAFSVIKNNAGSVTYVSLGFGLANADATVKIAAVKVDDTTTWEPSIANVESGTYNWARPFNVIFDITNKDSVKFVKYLLGNTVQKFIKSKDFVALTKEQIDLQKDLTKSDKTLYDSLKSDAAKLAKFFVNEDNKNYVYGLKI